jgi:hypothetical protein
MTIHSLLMHLFTLVAHHKINAQGFAKLTIHYCEIFDYPGGFLMGVTLLPVENVIR